MKANIIRFSKSFDHVNNPEILKLVKLCFSGLLFIYLILSGYDFLAYNFSDSTSYIHKHQGLFNLNFFTYLSICLVFLYSFASINSWIKLTNIALYTISTLVCSKTNQPLTLLLFAFFSYGLIASEANNREVKIILSRFFLLTLAMMALGKYFHQSIFMLPATCILLGIFPLTYWNRRLIQSISLHKTAQLVIIQGIIASKLLLLTPSINIHLNIIHSLTLFFSCISILIAITQSNLKIALIYFISSQLLFILDNSITSNADLLKPHYLIYSAFILAAPGLLLTIKALESRKADLHLVNPNGNYDSYPRLANSILLFGLVCGGFPLTLSYVGIDLMMENNFEYSHFRTLSWLVVLAVNALFTMKLFFYLCMGNHHQERNIDLQPTKYYITIVALVILFGSSYFLQ